MKSSVPSARWSSLLTCGATKTKLVMSRLETSSPTAPVSFPSVSKNTLPAQDLWSSPWAQVGQTRGIVLRHLSAYKCLFWTLVRVGRSLVGAVCPLSPQDSFKSHGTVLIEKVSQSCEVGVEVQSPALMALVGTSATSFPGSLSLVW